MSTAGTAPPEPYLLPLSAGCPEELERLTDQVADELDALAEHPGATAAALSERLRCQPQLAHRRALVVTDLPAGATRLRERRARHVVTAYADRDRPVVFLAAGVGDHHAGMGAELSRRLPGFGRRLERCVTELSRELGTELCPFLTRTPPAPGAGCPHVDDTAVAQPLMFAVQYAMAATLRSLGVEPSALLGYSLGEFVAACAAGIMTPPDAARVVARRARLVSELPPGGGMLAVLAGPESVADVLTDQVTLAALDGPELTVLAGPATGLESVARRLADRGVPCQAMSTRHAFHSPMMAPVVPRLRELLTAVELRPPAVPVLANGTGGWMGEEATSADYWAGQLCGPVRFTDNLAQLRALESPVLVELGPGQSMLRLATRSARQSDDGTAPLPVPTLPGPLERRPDGVVFLTAIARLWAAGTGIDLARADAEFH